MLDIIQELFVSAPPERVFSMFSTSAGLDLWWTRESSGSPELDGEYRLYFGPGFDWRAKVTQFVAGREFELKMTTAREDWIGTRVGCRLQPEGENKTRVIFRHLGWQDQNEHWRVSCYCWAMYLCFLRRNLEFGEFVPYEKRLDV